MRIAILIPTYNERENVEPLVRAIVAQMPQAQVVILDDQSPDGTGQKVAELQDSIPQLNLILRTTNRGFAPSYLDGFRWALLHELDAIVTMDADFSHDPKYLPAMLDALKEADVVVGSRYVRGGGVENWPWLRRVFSRAANLIAQVLTSVPVHDVTSGFQAYRREVLESIGFEDIRTNGYGFLFELKYRAYRHGFKMAEVPIVFVERRAGASKLSRRHIFEALILVFRLAVFRR